MLFTYICRFGGSVGSDVVDGPDVEWVGPAIRDGCPGVQPLITATNQTQGNPIVNTIKKQTSQNLIVFGRAIQLLVASNSGRLLSLEPHAALLCAPSNQSSCHFFQINQVTKSKLHKRFIKSKPPTQSQINSTFPIIIKLMEKYSKRYIHQTKIKKIKNCLNNH